jgi:hypothetical protein
MIQQKQEHNTIYPIDRIRLTNNIGFIGSNCSTLTSIKKSNGVAFQSDKF